MTDKQTEKYRKNLRELLARVRGTAAALEGEVRVPTGGESSGGLSNAPMHLGDLGSDVYAQELSATLLDTEAHLRDEVIAALERVEDGTFGTCADCSKAIPAARLNALPYVRYCVRCAEAHEGRAANFNDGRQQNWPDEYSPRQDGSEAEFPSRDGDRAAFTMLPGNSAGRDDERADTHAAGTPGGGSAVGGLAGTNVADGDPDNADLEDAMGSGIHDTGDEEADDDQTPGTGPGRQPTLRSKP